MTGQSYPVTPDTARAWIDVDLGALVRNGARLARRAGVPLLPMVKADAYGIGAVAAAGALDALEPWGFGIASVAEGRELRESGVRRPLLVTTPLLAEELPAARELALTPSLHRAPDIEAWSSSGLPWHLSIDTGMSRAGARWDEVGLLADAVRRSPPQGAYTHFHSAERCDGSREAQERRFHDALASLPARPALLHVENSAAVERCGAGSAWNLARPGVFLYGVESDADEPVEQVAALRARVVDVRTVRDGETVSYAATYRAVGERRVATVAAGYGDGYRRALSNRGVALLNGARVPVAGLVTMDMTMLDVTDVACDLGDVATLLGPDDRGNCLTVGVVAREADVSPYELLTGLRGRVPRRHVNAPAGRPA